jgi:predicted heme/steroid binding protein
MIGSLQGVESQASVAAWSNDTFGPAGSDLSCLTRANLEMAELLHAVAIEEPREKIVREIADVIIVLYRFCDRVGEDLADLVDTAGPYSGSDNDSPRDLILGANAYLSGLMYEGKMYEMAAFYMRQIGQHLTLAAHKLGARLADAIDAKMVINRARKWVVVGGHGQHVETPAIAKPEPRSNACCMYALGAEGAHACEGCR